MTFATGWRHRLAYPVLLLLGVVDAAGYSVIGPILPAVQRATGASVLAMVVWSQMGIAGYLVAPVLGGPLAESLGLRWLGLLPLTAALLLGGLAVFARRPGGFEV